MFQKVLEKSLIFQNVSEKTNREKFITKFAWISKYFLFKMYVFTGNGKIANQLELKGNDIGIKH
jgi:hypothetical protein